MSSIPTTGTASKIRGILLDTVLVEEPQQISNEIESGSSISRGASGNFEIYADPPDQSGSAESTEQDTQALAPPRRQTSPHKSPLASPARDIKSELSGSQVAECGNEENVPPVPLASAQALAPTVLCM